jgi:TolB-like protein/Tfp pilus assembly protein PilF
MDLNSFFTELRRRNVFRVAGVYTIVSWLILQVIAVVTPALHLPDWVDSFFAVAIIAGFPIALMFAWAFEMTPGGVKRTESVPEGESIRAETGQKLEYAILVGLIVVGALIIGNRIWPATAPAPQIVETSPGIDPSLPSALATDKSIAVLPFSDLSPGLDQAYFADGISEEILTALVKIKDLRVAGRTSSFVFKDNQLNLREISRTLNVSHILEGSVRKQNNEVRITARLTRGTDVIWNDSYDGKLESIFDLQENIARAIADELEIVMDTSGQTRLADTLTNSTESYDLFLRGRDLYRSSIQESDITQALGMLEKAVEMDPGFAEAWAALGEAYLSAPAIAGVLDGDEYLARAKSASERAIDLDPTLSFPYSILASVRAIHNEPADAMKLHDKALELDPKNPYAHSNVGLMLAMMGRSTDALPFLETAVELAPSISSYKSYLASIKRNLGEFDASDALAKQATDMGYFIAYDTLAWNAYSRGDIDEAFKNFMLLRSEGGAQLSPNFAAPELWESAARAYFTENESDIKYLNSMFEAYLQSPTAKITGTVVSTTARIGSYELFFEHVDEALAANAVALVGIWDDTENSRELRQHTGFADFARRSGMLEFWQEYGWPDKCKPVSLNDEVGPVFTCN